MSNKEQNKQMIGQIEKTEYAEKFQKLNAEVVSVLGKQAELNSEAYSLAKRVSETFGIGISVIFQKFLQNFDLGSARYCYLVRNSEKYSFMYSESVSGIFSKIRLIGYLISKNPNFDENITRKITLNGITLRILDLPFKAFKEALVTGRTKSADEILGNFSKTFSAIAEKYLDEASSETLINLADTLATLANSVSVKIKALQEAEAKKQAKLYSEFLKEFGLKDSDKSKKLFQKYTK